MHRLIHVKGKTLAVPVSSVKVKAKVPRRRKLAFLEWPVIYLSSWLRFCLESSLYQGFFFLAGRTLEHWDDVKRVCKTFWERYAFVDSDKPAFPESTLPVYLHGDEGRGLCKRPLLVISLQCAIPWYGENEVNSSQRLA